MRRLHQVIRLLLFQLRKLNLQYLLIVPTKSPSNEPLNEPECDNPVAAVVATIFPEPFTAVVVKLPEFPVTRPDDKESTCKSVRLAEY
jgi:hypothetical protein